MLDRGAGAERGIDIGLQRNATAAAAAFVGGDDQFRSAIADPVGERIGGKAAEHDRMDRADPRTGQHRRRRIGHHRQVERHAIAASDTKRRQHVRHPAYPVVQGAIGDARALAGFVAFPQDRDLVAARRQMPVETIGRYVDLAAVEPTDPEIIRREGHVLHRIERPHPVELCGLIAPIGIGRIDRGAALMLVLGRADAAGTCRGRWNDIEHEGPFVTRAAHPAEMHSPSMRWDQKNRIAPSAKASELASLPLCARDMVWVYSPISVTQLFRP